MNNRNKFALLTILNLLFFTALSSAQETNRIYIVALNYKRVMFAESLSLVNIDTSKSPQDYGYSAGKDFKLEIISSDNQVLKTLEFNVPKENNNLNFSISVPYFQNAKIMNIYDKDKNKVLEIPLKEESKLNLNWLYVTTPIILVIGFLVFIELKRKREHAELIKRRENQKIITLRNYVINNLRRGYSKEQIRNALIRNGYSNKDVDDAFRFL